MMTDNISHVYVLRSLKNRKRYVGSTKLSIETRIKQHHNGSNEWTRHNGPFELVYSERFLTFSEARKRENFLKSGAGRKFLDETLMAQFPPKADPPPAEVRASPSHGEGRRFQPKADQPLLKPQVDKSY